MEYTLYTYRARVERVIDGDSAVISIDCGFETWLHDQRFRLAGINTPELRGPEKEAGKIAKQWLKDRVEGKDVLIQTAKDKKGRYGRWIARIWIDDMCVNDELLANGMAVIPDYLK